MYIYFVLDSLTVQFDSYYSQFLHRLPTLPALSSPQYPEKKLDGRRSGSRLVVKVVLVLSARELFGLISCSIGASSCSTAQLLATQLLTFTILRSKMYSTYLLVHLCISESKEVMHLYPSSQYQRMDDSTFLCDAMPLMMMTPPTAVPVKRKRDNLQSSLTYVKCRQPFQSFHLSKTINIHTISICRESISTSLSSFPITATSTTGLSLSL